MLSEIYIIRETVSPEDLLLFLKKYIYGFTPMTTVYEYPQHASITEFQTDRAEIMMDYLIENEKTNYRFYFSNLHFMEEVQNGIIIFNPDHSLTLGVWVDEALEEKYAEQLRDDFAASFCVLTRGQLPPDDYAGFVETALKS